jgi:hypothetical protein
VSLQLPADPEELKSVLTLKSHGLVEMKPTGEFGLSPNGWELAKALRVLDDMYAREFGAPQTRRDVNRPRRPARNGT